jgi:GNAT superfamily N-acetyltransferase
MREIGRNQSRSLLLNSNAVMMSQSDKSAEDDAISLGSEDSSDDDADDDDYVPPEQRGIKKKRSKKPRKPKQPDLVALSLPKPTRRLDPDLDLGDAALSGCSFDDLDISGWCAIPGWQRREGFLPSSAPASAKLQLLPGRRPTRGAPEDVRVAEYRAIYSVQLPGMPFYHSDVCHALLTLDPAGEDVSGGATFRIGLLRTKEPRGGPVLVFDVLALAVHPERARGGVGSMLVSSLKAMARKEAAARGVRPLLLTQADLSCIGFWAKQSFARAHDANALVRSLRRASGHTIFDGATPMALALPDAKTPAKVGLAKAAAAITKKRRASLSAGSRVAPVVKSARSAQENDAALKNHI